MTCAFRHVFGEPGKGAHAPRMFGVAAVDLGLTALCAVLIAWARRERRRPWLIAVFFWFGVLMILAYAAHVAVGVDTALTVRLRGHPSPCGGSAVAAATPGQSSYSAAM
jgi:hypothetical protein